MLTDAEKLLIGCILGDGSLHRRFKYKNVCSITLCHTKPQYDYLVWKADQLKSVLNSKAKIGKSINNFGLEYYRWCAGISSYSHIYDLVYPSGKKTFKLEWLSELGPRELALFWCDDGGIVKQLRSKVDTRTGKAYPNPLQETYGSLAIYEPLEECEAVATWIESITDEKPKSVLHKKTGLYYLKFNKKQLSALVDSITEYVPDCMVSKLDLFKIPIEKRAQVQKQRAIRRQECAAT